MLCVARDLPQERHTESCRGDSISLCSVWKEFCLQEPPNDNSRHCALCGGGFVSCNHLKRHVKDSYWRLFKFSHNLKRHMKSHSGENAYQCAPCDKYFISCHHIKRHMQSHAWDNIPMLVNKFISRTTRRDTCRVMLDRLHIIGLCVARVSSPGATQSEK